MRLLGIELNPRYALAREWYGGWFDTMGRNSEAIAERRPALELDPLSLLTNFKLGLAFYYRRDYDHAIEQFQKTLEMDQNFPPLQQFLPASYDQPPANLEGTICARPQRRAHLRRPGRE